jgi:hypothetical protein
MILIQGKVVSGYGVASGKGKDSRYPNGTLYLQMPFFKKKGLDLESYFRGTINVNISPYHYTIINPTYYLKGIDWSAHIPPENFYFFKVKLLYKNSTYEGLIYMPDPETKTDHHQINTLLEVMMPPIENLKSGAKVILQFPKDSLQFSKDKRDEV